MRPSARKTKCSIANVWKLGSANRPGSLGSNSLPHHRAQEVPQERTYRDLADLQYSSSLVTRESSTKFPAHRRANLVRAELLRRGTICREIALAGSRYSTSEKPVP